MDNIVELFNRLAGQHTLAEITEWFFKKGFIVKILNFSSNLQMVIIFYLDHIQLWERWARQARGTILYLDTRSNSWRLLKYTLPRGAEVLTNFHRANQISSTSNQTETNLGIFDDNQQRVMWSLTTPSPLPGYLSMKVDGMLVCVTLYTGHLADLVRTAIMASDDTFAKIVVGLASGCNFVPVISTQKTFNVVSAVTIQYIVTAIIVSTSAISYDDLVKEINETGLTAENAFAEYGAEFIKRIAFFADGCEWLNIAFEAVNPNRTCAWGHVHTELTINYNQAFMNVLSMSHDLITVPHFRFSPLICKSGFQEPLWWRIDNSVQVNDMLADLSLVIIGRMEERDYLGKYPPNNEFRTMLRLDYEGFVLWSDFDGILDYHKVKSREYYESHKPKDLAALVQIGKISTVFGEANNAMNILRLLKEKFMVLLTHLQDPDHHVYLLSQLPERAQKACANLTGKSRYMAMISSDAWYPLCRRIFHEVFPAIQLENTDDGLLKCLVRELEPWTTPDTGRIHRLIDQPHRVVEQFYFLMKRTPIEKKPIPFTEFFIFGCPLSRDIDICVVAKNREDVLKDVPIDMSYLKLELTKLGYDTNRKIDVCVVYLEKDRTGNYYIDVSSKAGPETQNIIYYTYRYHNQKYPCPFTTTLMITIESRIAIISKYIMDNLRELIGRDLYLRYRDERRIAYQGKWNRVNFAMRVIKEIQVLDPDCIKSLTMKLIQLILLEHGLEEYTKEGLANQIDRLHPGTNNHALWFLFRGTRGEYSLDFLNLLRNEFIRIAESIEQDELQWTNLTVNLTVNCSDLPDAVFHEFVRSPLQPTTLFEQEFYRICPDRDMNKLFRIVCQNTDKLPANLVNHAIVVDQRTPEWLELLTYYKCGSNTGVVPYDGNDWVPFYYNLIRGSLIEQIIIRACDFGQLFKGAIVTKITVGFLVKENVKGADAIAPDLLLLVDGKIIPVEIKCVPSKPTDNANYRRAVSLATRQLESCAEILKCDRGLIVIVYAHDVIEVKACVVKL